MKNFRISEPVMWAFLVIGALAGAIMIGWQLQTEWNELPTAEQRAVLGKSEVEAIASTFVQEHFSVETDSFRTVSSITTAVLPDSFLTQSYLPKNEINTYRDKYLSAVSVYSVRFFKEGEIEEYSVEVDAYRGDIVSFMQTLPEDAEIPGVSDTVSFSLTSPESEAVAVPETDEVKAIEAARKYVAEEINVSPESLSVHDKSEETLPGGIERLVTFSWTESEVDSEYGKGFVTFDTTIRGDKVTSFYPSFEYPEPFERALEKSSSLGMLVGFGSMLAWVFIIIASLVFMIRAFSAHTAVWKLSLGVVIGMGILSIVDLVNAYPEMLAWYTTTDTIVMHWIFTIIAMVLGVALVSLSFFIPSVAGHTLAVENYQERIAPLNSKPSTPDVKKAYRLALTRGYLLGIFFLGFTFALYWLGDNYLGVWYPYGDLNFMLGLGNFVPAFTLMLSLGITAAITEEITFRLFGILWISKLTKSTTLGVLIATLVWAFAHTDGSVLPVWFRGVEVFLGGLLFAYFFMRYNILTTIVAHYVHNIIIACVLLLFTFGAAQLVPALLIFMMPAIVYIIFEVVVSKRALSVEKG